MRKVVFGGANSLDNYIARESGAVDWILWSDEAGSIMKELWRTIDTVLWGAKLTNSDWRTAASFLIRA